MPTLLLAPELFTTDSGIPRILRLYLRALAEISGEGRTSFVTLNDAVADSRDLQVCGLGAKTQWAACNRNKARFAREAVRLAGRARFVICGHAALAPVAWLAKRLRGTRYAVVAHGIEVWRPFSLWERLALRGANAVWCVSHYTRQELLRHCPLQAGRVRVLPNGLDPALAGAGPASAPPDGPPLILAVGRLVQSDAYKGIDHLIAALPAIRHAVPEARLRIVGRGDDSPRLQRLAGQLGVRAGVEFPGYVGDAELPGEFARCRMLALPSAGEGFGLVYLEAMAAGRPCLAAAAGGAPEVVDETCGRLVSYGDPAAIAAACIEILNTPWSPEAIRTRVLARFGFDTFRQHLAAALQELAVGAGYPVPDVAPGRTT